MSSDCLFRSNLVVIERKTNHCEIKAHAEWPRLAAKLTANCVVRANKSANLTPSKEKINQTSLLTLHLSERQR